MIGQRECRRGASTLNKYHCRWTLAALLGAAAAMVWAGSLQAHEIGTTHVLVQFQSNRSYKIEITTDAQSLVDKLSSLGGDSGGIYDSPAALQTALQKYDPLFRRRLTIAFDGMGVDPAIEYFVSPAADATSPPTASIKL